MAVYIENFFLFILCSVLCINGAVDLVHILYVLVAFSLICFDLVNEKVFIRICLKIAILLISMVQPIFLIFTPSFCYISFYRKKYYLPILLLFLNFVNFKTDFLAKAVEVLLLMIFSFYVSEKTRKMQELRNTIHELRDNSVEHENILKEKNQELLDKKNDELYIAVLQERNRIAREIHDNVGHMLSRSILQLGALLAICKDEILRPHLVTLNETLNEAMNNIRNSVHDLHDEAIKLEDAVNSLIQNFTFCPVKFSYQVTSKVPKKIKYCLLAIIKEALNNVIKHSNASEVTISIKEHFAFYQLLIKDNGTLISSDLENTSGIGLKSMKERVALNKGIIHITVENGLRIFITIPK